jgi:hypothetical protein
MAGGSIPSQHTTNQPTTNQRNLRLSMRKGFVPRSFLFIFSIVFLALSTSWMFKQQRTHSLLVHKSSISGGYILVLPFKPPMIGGHLRSHRYFPIPPPLRYGKWKLFSKIRVLLLVYGSGREVLESTFNGLVSDGQEQFHENFLLLAIPRNRQRRLDRRSRW